MGSTPADESVLLIPALEVGALVDEHRMRYDPAARAGVPAHITIMYPFLDPARLMGAAIEELDSVLHSVVAFAYSLTHVAEFEQGVLYLAPEPTEPFIELTGIVGERFGLEPFGGAYPTVIPHLTVMQSGPAAERKRIGDLLKNALPASCRATEVRLMVGHNKHSWQTTHVVSLR